MKKIRFLIFALFVITAMSGAWASEDTAAVSLNFPSVQIKEEAFMNNTAIGTVIISDGADVGAHAFLNCSNLTVLIAPGKDITIAPDAFEGCPLKAVYCDEGSGAYEFAVSCGIDAIPMDEILKPSRFEMRVLSNGSLAVSKYTGAETSVNIPDEVMGLAVTEIGECAFKDNGTIKSVSIPSSVKKIGRAAFSGCLSLTGVTLNEGLQTIASDAFAGCKALTTISLPESLRLMEGNPFVHCSYLKTISVSQNHSYFRLENGMLIDTQRNKVVSFPCALAIAEIEIPDGIEAIGEKAFWRATHVTSVIMPESLKVIEKYAFYECCHLKSAAFAAGLLEIKAHAFSGCERLTGVEFPESIVNIGSQAFKNCRNVDGANVCEGTNVASDAFLLDEAVSGYVLNIIPLYQFDYQETATVYNYEKKSVATSGCGATCASMVIRYLTGNMDQTPHTLFVWACKNGYYAGSGLTVYAIDELCERNGVETSWTKDSDEAEEALKNGYPVIASMGEGTFTDGGHYILLRGIDENGKILVNDPNSVELTNSSFDMSLIVSEINRGFCICKVAD
ncbi:MAG: leucine-rich repeat protein [Clostridia bacterium]|nr:leucine-rich repeat protein [Clostridia bacterium]